MNSLLGRDATFISTDVNTTAIDKTQAAVDTARADVIRADLFSCFRPGSLFEIVVFNPPYVPTDEDEFQRSLLQRDISASWAGGRDGREVTDRFLLDARNFMRDNGVIYLVIIDLNHVEATMTYAKGLGYQCEIAGSRLAGIEKLYILRLHKAPNR